MDMIFRHAAQYVDSKLLPGMTFGVTRGATVAGVMKYLSNKFPRPLDLKIVQLVGSEVNENPTTSSGDIIRNIIRIYGGKAYYLSAPMYVEKASLHKDLLNEPIIRKVLDIGKHADIIISGVGMLNPDIDIQSSIWSGFIDKTILNELLSLGGVGYMFAHVFNIKGELIDHPINRQIISVKLEDLAKVETTIAIACGLERGAAVLGAIRSGHVKILITDRSCAKAMLALLDSDGKAPQTNIY